MQLIASQLASILVPMVMIEALFSGSELALLSADRLALQKQAKKGHSGAKLALELTSRPERIFSTTLLMTCACAVAITILIEHYFSALDTPFAEIKSVLVASPIIVLFGELIPKTLFRRFSAQLAPVVAVPVYWAYYLFYPFTKLLSGYTTRISRMIGPIEEMIAGKRRTTRDDLETLLSYEKSETEIQSNERLTIKRILEFRETLARHALIPLFRVDAVESEVKIREALEMFKTNQHSRMPVYQERIDNIVGILEVNDLISAPDLDLAIENHIAPARYVPETQALEDILLEMRRDQEHMVVVVDEHGGAVGILTFEDIVEEIVGEISDEYDHELAPYKELSPGKWLVQARMEISAINEQLLIELPEGEYETLGGFLLEQFGKIPETRDELYFSTPAGTYKFSIRKATERQIISVLVETLEGSGRSEDIDASEKPNS